MGSAVVEADSPPAFEVSASAFPHKRPALQYIVDLVLAIGATQQTHKTQLAKQCEALENMNATQKKQGEALEGMTVAMQGLSLKLERTDASVSALRADMGKMQEQNDEVQGKLQRLKNGPVSPTGAGAASLAPPTFAQVVDEPWAKKARAEASGSVQAPAESDSAEGWKWVPPSRPPPASAGRVVGGPSADDRRKVVVRGFDGPVPREALSVLLEPLLQRLGSRFDRFGGKRVALWALLLLKSEDYVQEVLRDFRDKPVSVVLTTGGNPIKLRVGASSPPSARWWNGFNMNVKTVITRDRRVEKVTGVQQRLSAAR